MLRLGHISYSNCVPVHGRFLVDGTPPSLALVQGLPAELNRQLARGAVDVAPASSIEFARHSERYRIVPGLSISAPGAVRTILLLARRPLEELSDGARLALPTASATSVVLLKVIMRQLLGIQPEYFWFRQHTEDPLASGAAAALYIGDVAHRQRGRPDLRAHDLAELWREWTGLPFVFALWQTSAGPDKDDELRALSRELIASREWSFARLPRLAADFAADYGWEADELLGYWQSLDFGWSEGLEKGLVEFYRRAAELDEIERVPALVFLGPR